MLRGISSVAGGERGDLQGQEENACRRQLVGQHGRHVVDEFLPISKCGLDDSLAAYHASARPTYHETTTQRDDQEPMNDLEQPESGEELELNVTVKGSASTRGPKPRYEPLSHDTGQLDPEPQHDRQQHEQHSQQDGRQNTLDDTQNGLWNRADPCEPTRGLTQRINVTDSSDKRDGDGPDDDETDRERPRNDAADLALLWVLGRVVPIYILRDDLDSRCNPLALLGLVNAPRKRMRLGLRLEPQKRNIAQLELLQIGAHLFEFLVLLADKRRALLAVHLAADQSEEALFPGNLAALLGREVFLEQGVDGGCAFRVGRSGRARRKLVLLDVLDGLHQHLSLARLEPQVLIVPLIIHVFDLLGFPAQPDLDRC